MPRFLPLALCLLATTLGAQQPVARDTAVVVGATAFSARAYPREVAAQAEDIYATAAVRDSGSITIDSTRTVMGHVALLDGTLTLAGHVTGSVLVVDGDLAFRPGARVDGDVLVVGGRIIGAREATVAGEMRDYAEHTGAGGAREENEAARWWRRWERRQHEEGWSDFQLASAGPYNRVEGLPVAIGPRLRHSAGPVQIRLDAQAVLRTALVFSGDSNRVGHDLRLEVRDRRARGVGIGAEHYDLVAPVEAWKLSDLEVGLASFLVRRDYRDYYARRGGRVYATAFVGPDAELTLSYADERWRALADRNVFSLFRSDDPWRPNPMLDGGRLHLVSGTVRIDTRNDVSHPWSGWYLTANIEGGMGELTSLGPTDSTGVSPIAARGANYTRGLLDLRRYNRLGPNAQLNLRGVIGGWMGGDPLPLERRLSVDGPGALPGFGFRRAGSNPRTCNDTPAAPGQPALCERIALGQVEYRGSLHVDPISDWITGDRYGRFGRADWVAFVDAGAGFGHGRVPRTSQFQSDLGLGLDLELIGVFVAKPVSANGPAVFFVRLHHRF